MRIPYGLYKHCRITAAGKRVQIGDLDLSRDDALDFGALLGMIPVVELVAALDRYTTAFSGERGPQLAALVFDVTGRPRALDHYFPILRILRPLEVDSFYELVGLIVRHPNFQVMLMDADGTQSALEIPPAVFHLIAGHLAELYFHRRAILERLLTCPRRIRLYSSQASLERDGGVSGGDYNPSLECIQLLMDRLFEGFFEQSPGVCPFVHEFGHMLDHFHPETGSQGESRGVLPGLDPRDGELFNPAARSLFISGKLLEAERYDDCSRHGTQSEDAIPIGHPYVFTNDSEFIAGYLEMFFRNPHYFAARNPDLYGSFAALFGYDPRPAWVEDFPDYIAQNRASYLSGEHLPRHGITLPD